MNQPILLYRSGSVYANETAAWAALDAVTHKKGQPIVAFYTLSSPVSGHHGSSTIGAIFAIGIGDGVGQYKACTSHDDMLIVAQSLNAHITQFNQMFEYDANHNAIKAKLDFYTTDGKSISAGGIGGGSSASIGALYQLVDVMANSSNTGVEGAVEGSVLAYDGTAGKWKAIAQSKILPDMSGYYTKDETDSAINTAKSNLQGQVDTIQALIPATASADNQLADKDFVNSSIATATAEFKGSFTSLDELKATSGNLNDYAFYLHNDSVGNSIVDRYKWTAVGWLYEYSLNNSSFTAEQWAALNSAITATLVQSYNSHLKNTTIHITAAERTAWNKKWDYDEETIKAVKVTSASSADSVAWSGISGKPTNLSAFTNDVGYITGITKSMVEGVLTGNITSHTHSYLPLSGGTLTGNISTKSFISGTDSLGFYLEANSNLGLRFQYNKSTTGSDYDHLLLQNGVLKFNSKEVLHSGNYNSYAPTLTGTGASGTWGISISGNAATATKLQTPRTIWGKYFDGLSDISGDLTDVGNITASGKATIQGDIISGGEVAAIVGDGTPAGVTDYSALTGKPAINGVTLLSGNNTLTSLGIQAAGDYATNSGVTTLLTDYATKTFVSNNYAGKAAFNSHTADTDIHITAEERVAWNAKWDYNEATIKAVKVTSASSADSVAWSGITDKPTTFTPSAHTHTASEVSGLPTKLSAFNNDVGYITGITKSMVEGVLTGEISSHTHSYLPLSGGTLTGRIVCDHDASKSSNYTWRNSRQHSGGGGRADSFIVLLKADSAFNASFGTYGDGETDSYIYIGYKNYNDLNLRIGATSISWGDNPILHSGNYNSYAPTLTGTGASGTWGISISGNAATANGFKSVNSGASIDLNTVLRNGGVVGNYGSSLYWVNQPSGMLYGSVVQIISNAEFKNTLALQLAWDINHNSTSSTKDLWFRASNNLGWQNDWKTIYHSGNLNASVIGTLGTLSNNISGNAASATKLQTPRTIWGQPFDGMSDVNGDAHIIGDLVVDGEVSALVA